MNEPVVHIPKLLYDDLRLHDDESGPDFDTLWRILWRRRLAALCAFFLFCCLGMSALLVLRPSFTAHAVMSVSSTQPDLTATDQVSPSSRSSALAEADVESQIQLMSSNRALLKVARDLELTQHDRIGDKKRDWRGEIRAFINRKWWALAEGEWTDVFDLTFGRGEPSAQTPQTGQSDDAIVEFMRSRLRIQPIAKSTTIDIAFTAADPEIAAKVANAVAENYIAVRQSVRLDQAQRATSYLARRAQHVLDEVTAAEKLAENARAANVLGDGRDIQQLGAEMDKVNAQLASAKVAVVIAKTELRAAEKRVQEVGIVGALQPGQSQLVDRLREFASQARTKLEATRADRGAGHPESQRAAKEYAAAQSEVAFEAEARMNKLRADVTVANQQVAMLETSLKSLRAEHDRMSAVSLDLKGLERKAAAYRSVYEAILGRLRQTEQIGFNEAENWLIAAAIPPSSPASPNFMLIIGMTLCAASVGAIGLALLLEYQTRETIISSQQVMAKGIRALAMVPDLGLRGRSLKRVLTARRGHKQAAFRDAIDSLFTSVSEQLRGKPGCQVLIVTSSLPFEGKSTTITALAARMVSSGRRVLLIDADLRAPRLHRAFGIKNDRGLLDCLQPLSCPSDSVYFDARSGISVVTAGPRTADPQNVLRSPQFHELLQMWKLSYDFILIDTPPVLPIPDVRILVPLSDICIFVTRWRSTRWKVALHALTLLRESGAEVAGIVVSKVRVAQLQTYGFADSQVYGKEYHRYSARGVSHVPLLQWSRLLRPGR
jgi:succinoglycan biosynthesis transport protein ExoP